jgi:hypothetical protein
MAVDTTYTDPSTGGALDLATGQPLPETVWDKLLSNIKAIGSTDNSPILLGWIPANITWTYATPTTFTVVGDYSSILTKGMKWKATNTTAKSGHILSATYSAPNTTLTICGDALASADITSNYYSNAANPAGFAHWFNYTPTGPTNTTLTGRFSISERRCRVIIRGAVTSAPSFATMPTLPVAAGSSAMTVYSTLSGYLDSGTAFRLGKIMGVISASATNLSLYNGEAAADMGLVSATSPITWANNDYWSVEIEYEI